MNKLKYSPGKHYHEAHVALNHSKYGILGEKDGEIIASGSVSVTQVKELQKRDLKMIENDFVVDYKEYAKLVQEFIYEKEDFIEKNHLLEEIQQDILDQYINISNYSNKESFLIESKPNKRTLQNLLDNETDDEMAGFIIVLLED